MTKNLIYSWKSENLKQLKYSNIVIKTCFDFFFFDFKYYLKFIQVS